MKKELALGKFAPFHKGHEFLNEHALSRVDILYVMVYESDEYAFIDVHQKAAWITSRFPNVSIITAENGPKCTGYTQEIMREQENYILKTLSGIKIDVFFSSERYSTHVSEALNAEGVIVDRHKIPISASQIRANPFQFKHYLSDNVYQELITKVVFMGAPSTGKTTTATALAKHFDTELVLEYGRTYWEQNQIDRLLTQEQLLHIAEEQIKQEDEATLQANKYLFVDTNALTTWHFAHDYYGCALPELDKLADESKDRFDIVFLCGDEIPFEDTWERSGEVKRKAFQIFIEKELIRRGIHYIKLTGSVDDRVQNVIRELARIELDKCGS